MVAGARAETTAFYYGPDIPRELSAAYDQIVVEPRHVRDVQALAKAGAVPVAYFSIGEIGGERLASIDKAWVLARNQAWASAVMDLEQPGYRAYVLAQLEELWRAGYRRFFLDTLDSYQLGAKDAAARERLRRASCELLKSMAERHPDARWLLNRGFELLPEVSQLVHGVVAESLFDRWDAAHGRYVPVPDDDRAWLLARLREVQSRYHLPVIVIDYRPASQRAEARATARKIAALGFQPWVCNAALDDVGVGPVEIMPRHVLILSDEKEASAQNGSGLWLAPVIEYLGYVPDYRRVAEGLPQYDLTGRYAGIITLFQSGGVSPEYEAWLLRQVRAGVRVVMFGALGFAASSATARELGIEPLPAVLPGTARQSAVTIAKRDALIGFEADPPPHDVEGVAIRVRGPDVTPHLEIRTRGGAIATAIATTRFGGLALSHVFALRGLAGERAWVLEPFAFLKSALALPDMPVPDVTTESGRRVALFAIDVQGLADHARLRGSPPVWRVLRDEILSRNAWPHALGRSDAASSASTRDIDAAHVLVRAGVGYEADIAAGSTAPRGIQRSLTLVEPLWSAHDPEQIPAPTAQDASFFDGAAEAYPLRRVLEAFTYTDGPRRLRPIALHYHAYAANSPGGLDALAAVYGWLSQQALFAVRVADYRERVKAFREQVIGRALDGSYTVFGGEALRTVRLPASLGWPDLSHSLGVGALATLPQGRYLTFVAYGARRVAFTSAPPDKPHLSECNGRIEQFAFESEDGAQARLRVVADGRVALRMAGLRPHARCSLALARRVELAVADAEGEAVFALAERDTGSALFACAGASGG